VGIQERTVAVQPDPNSLDYDFHRFIGMNPEGQRAVQRFYLPYFAKSQRVVDLACGDGDFVALLLEQGVDAVGVDADVKTCANAQAKGLPVICQNVFDYLAATSSASVDGIFCAHLVEHLAYPQVLDLVHEAARILRPGGRVILATPDCRSLYSHLDMYYLHFGHVSFYHPRLLSFMLEHEGFGSVEYDANPNTASYLLPNVQATARRAPAYHSGPGQSLPYQRTIPLQGSTLLHKLSYAFKRRLAQWLVLPFTDSLATLTHERLASLDGELQRLGRDLQGINGPFECFATGIKADAGDLRHASKDAGDLRHTSKDAGEPGLSQTLTQQ
jgi:SAM-dependent methyltransferase